MPDKPKLPEIDKSGNIMDQEFYLLLKRLGMEGAPDFVRGAMRHGFYGGAIVYNKRIDECRRMGPKDGMKQANKINKELNRYLTELAVGDQGRG